MKNCIFCKIIKGEINSWKVYENKYVYAFLDINPINKYHTLVIPKKHYENMFDISEKDLTEVILGVKKLVKLYEKKLEVKNIQILNNSGVYAQQDVFHIHFHIIPRFKGDNQNIKWKTNSELTKDYDTFNLPIIH